MKRSWLWIGLILLILLDGFFVHWWISVQRENQFDSIIVKAAKRYGMEPALVKAVVWQESKFQADAVGRAGELGLMQLTDAAAYEWADAEKIRTFEPEHLLDPTTNTYAGTFYLAKVMKRYLETDDPIPYALANYNAGRTHVLRWQKGEAKTNSLAFQEAIDIRITKHYVAGITKRRDYYREKFSPLPEPTP